MLVLLEIDTWVRIEPLEAKLVDHDLVEMDIPLPAALLQPVKSFLQPQNLAHAILIARWLAHVDLLLEISIQVCTDNIKLMHLHVVLCANHQQHADRVGTDDRHKCVENT